MKTYKGINPYHGYHQLPRRTMHTHASAILTATDILINAGCAVDDTGKTMIMLSTPLYRELLATLRGIAHDINPPGLELRSSNRDTALAHTSSEGRSC